MLTIPAVTKLYSEGVDIIYRKKPIILQLKGEYDPSTREVYVYTHYQESEEDIATTILHEFIHARNDIIRGIKDIEECVEEEAKITLKRNPHVIIFIHDLCDLETVITGRKARRNY